MSTWKEISISQLTNLSMPQLASLQNHLQQMNNMHQPQQNQQQQQQQQHHQSQSHQQQSHQQQQQHQGDIGMNGKGEGTYRHTRQNSSLTQQMLAQQQQQQQQQQQHQQQQQQFQYAQQQQQHFQQPFTMNAPNPFHTHLLTSAQPHYIGFGSPYAAHPVLAATPTVVTKSVPKRGGRAGTASRLSPTPFPATVNLKLKRKLRKNNREKQRRSEINDQFEILCHMLGLGAAANGATANSSANSSANHTTSNTPTPGNNSAPKVEKFAILSEACHTITQLRLELSIYKSEKAENRLEFQKLEQHLEGSLKSGIRADEFLSRFFPNLQRADVVLPPSKPQQPKTMDSDDDLDEADEDEMADGSKLDRSESPELPPTKKNKTRGNARATQSASSVNTSNSNPHQPTQTTSPPLSNSHPFGLGSPPPMANPLTIPNNFNFNGPTGDSNMLGLGPSSSSASHQPSSSFGRSSPMGISSHHLGVSNLVGHNGQGRSSPSLAALISGRPVGVHRDQVSSGGRQRQSHSRSSSSSALPRFGSTDFGTSVSAASAVAGLKASHSRQASHARSRSLQMSLNGQLLKDGIGDSGSGGEDGAKLVGGGGHSRTGSQSIPPPPAIPAARGMHSAQGSLDAFGMNLSVPQYSSQPHSGGSFYAPSTHRLRTGHGRHPSGSSSSVLGGFMQDQPHSAQLLQHGRHRSTASISAADMLFPTVNMDDVELNNVFENGYGQ